MIIVDRGVTDEELFCSPVYLLTGDLETARFYSNLASACSKFGTFLEKQIKGIIQLPFVDYDEIKNINQKSLLIKRKIDGVEPDFVIVDPIEKTISVCEVKSNMYNMDSKQCKTENKTGQILKDNFNNNFEDFSTELYLVNFFGYKPNKRGQHVVPLTNNFTHINGNIFCSMMSVNYDNIVDNLKNSQTSNVEFIINYKKMDTIV